MFPDVIPYATGATLKTVLLDVSSGALKIYRAPFEPYTSGNVAGYGIATSESGNPPGCYTWSVPAGLLASTAAFPYLALTLRTAGASLAAGDFAAPVWQRWFDFDGSNVGKIINANIVQWLGSAPPVPQSSILADIVSALAGQQLILQSPVGSGSLIIIAKDAYLASDQRQLKWTKPSGANWPVDLTGWTVTFTATKTLQNANSGTGSITATGAVNVTTGTSQQVQVELTSVTTSGLAPGAAGKGYIFDVVATNGSDRATLVNGYMSVAANVTA